MVAFLGVASGFIPRFCGLRGVNSCDSWRKASRYRQRISRSERVYPAIFHYGPRINRSERVYPAIFNYERRISRSERVYPAIFHYGRRISRSERVYPAILWFASFFHGACNASHSGSGRCLGNLSTNHCASLLKIFQYGQTSLVAKSCAR